MSNHTREDLKLYPPTPTLLSLTKQHGETPMTGIKWHNLFLDRYIRDHSQYVLSHWKKALHSNASSHWLSPYRQLRQRRRTTPYYFQHYAISYGWLINSSVWLNPVAISYGGLTNAFVWHRAVAISYVRLNIPSVWQNNYWYLRHTSNLQIRPCGIRSVAIS